MAGGNAKTFIVVGGTGEGKSEFIKKNLIPKFREFPKFIFDPNNEYTQFDNQVLEFPRIDEFISIAQKATNSLILFEEATAFFNNRIVGQNMIELLVRKRHANNFYIIVFHSLRSIPVQLFEFTNYLILYKTNDRADMVMSKYKDNPEIIEAFQKIQKLPKYSNVSLTLY